MRKLTVSACLLAAAIWLLPVIVQSQVLDHKSFSIVGGGGQTGEARNTCDMFYLTQFGTDGYSWSGGAVGVQGGGSQTLMSSIDKPVYAVPANVTFKFDIGATVDALNTQYGAGNWTIANPTLYLQYTLYANNKRFGAGAGTFDIFWVANDSWYQDGTVRDRNPLYASTAAALSAWSGGQALLTSVSYPWSTPNYTGTYNDLQTDAWATDKGGDRQAKVTYSLAADPAAPDLQLVGDVVSATAASKPYVSLYLMATSPTIGMTIFTGGGGVLPSFNFDVVRATAQGSYISVDDTAWAFDATLANNVSGAQRFTVTSHGTLPCTVAALSLSGTNAAEFAVKSGTDTCSGKTLNYFDTCTVDVEFAPASTGKKETVLNIPSNAVNKPNLTVKLSGFAPPTPLWVDLASYDYGSVVVGISRVQAFTVTNIQVNQDGSQLTATVAIAMNAAAGARLVRVETPNGESMRLSTANTFNVQ